MDRVAENQATATAPAERQLWIGRFPGQTTVTGSPKLVIPSAIAGFGSGKGRLRGYLLDCDTNGRACAAQPIATASLSAAEWGSGPGVFASKTLAFSSTDHVLASGRTLVLRLAAQKGSEPLIVAYGTSTHQAFLSFDTR